VAIIEVTKNLSDEAILRELGARLEAARLARNLTQKALAEEAGVSKRTVERLEGGEVASRLSAFIRICRVLGLVDRLDALVPPPAPSPLEELKLAGRRRKRASRPARSLGAPAKKAGWTWGDDT
jgi:transcriptional regulator with XRE-family HTH domain